MGDGDNDPRRDAADADDGDPSVTVIHDDGETRTTVHATRYAGLNLLKIAPDLPTLMGFAHQFVYEREKGLVRSKTKGLTNYEVRAIIVGLWSSLERDDQEDTIKELTAYLDPKETTSSLSQLIRDTVGDIRRERSDANAETE
jgi:hypothetical protein